MNHIVGLKQLAAVVIVGAIASFVLIVCIHLPLWTLERHLFSLYVQNIPAQTDYYSHFESVNFLGWFITALMTPFIIVRISLRILKGTVAHWTISFLVYIMLEVPYMVIDWEAIKLYVSLNHLTDPESIGLSELVLFINLVLSTVIILVSLHVAIKRWRKLHAINNR